MNAVTKCDGCGTITPDRGGWFQVSRKRWAHTATGVEWVDVVRDVCSASCAFGVVNRFIERDEEALRRASEPHILTPLVPRPWWQRWRS